MCTQVCKSETGYKKRVPVFFFGTHQMYVASWPSLVCCHSDGEGVVTDCCFLCRGHLPPRNIVPYIGNKLKYGGGTFFKGFAEGMWEIQNTPAVGSKLKVSGRSRA